MQRGLCSLCTVHRCAVRRDLAINPRGSVQTKTATELVSFSLEVLGSNLNALPGAGCSHAGNLEFSGLVIVRAELAVAI